MTRRRGWLLGGGIAAVLLVAVASVIAIGVWQASSRPATAEETAQAYLQALSTGDADAVASTGVALSDDARAAFSGATSYIDDATVTGTDRRGGSTTVDVSFRLDDIDRTATLTLTRHDGGWRLERSALGLLDARLSAGSAVSIGDVVVPSGDPIALPPAVYDIAAAPTTLLDGTSTASLLPGETRTVEVDVELRDAATTAAQDVLDEHLEACTADGGVPSDTVAPPEACGVRLPWGTDFREVADVAFRVEALPTVSLTPTMFTAGGGVLIATVRGTGQDGSARTTTYRTDAWTVRGDVAFTPAGIELTVW